MCASKFTVFLQLHSQKTFCFSKETTSAENICPYCTKWRLLFMYHCCLHVYIEVARGRTHLCYWQDWVIWFEQDKSPLHTPPTSPTPIPLCLFRQPWLYNWSWSKDTKKQLKLFNKSGCLENRDPQSWLLNLKTKIAYFCLFCRGGRVLLSQVLLEIPLPGKSTFFWGRRSCNFWRVQ